MDVDGPRLDLWRAPIDNDELGFSVKPAAQWREAGLHRMHHKTLSVDAGESGLNVRERVAAAGVGHGMDVAYRWTVGDDGTLWLTVDLEPHGAWPCTLPRRGVALTLPGSLEHVEWFGAGPGEAYRDTGNDARIGRFRATVVEMQTP
jgi:beta-galactosidase